MTDHDQLQLTGTRVVGLPSGRVRVLERDGVLRARGLRYATARRFSPPVPVPPWEGVLDATERGAVCPQVDLGVSEQFGPVREETRADEDCLTVTVTAPAGPPDDGRSRPVMVWIHGGAYLVGDGDGIYDPTALVAENDVVVVTVNYRLGILGYLGIEGVAPANLGLLDQLEALRWVRREIAGFGGDPGQVTVFGESAGGDAVFCLLLADGAEGLFRHAVVQSAPLGLRTGRSPMTAAMGAAARRALPPDPQRAPVADLLRAQEAALRAASRFRQAGLAFGPAFGEAPLPAETDVPQRLRRAAAAGTDLLAGWTADDALPFVDVETRISGPLRRLPGGDLLRRGLGRAVTGAVFSGPTRRLVRRYRAAGGRAQTYAFEWAPPGSRFGACHAIELPFLFGSPQLWRSTPMLGDDPAAALDRIGPRMRRLWAGTARHGLDPAGPRHHVIR
ncbi:carboxylesterase family protein [Kineococcus sp. NUM-3379]